MNMRLKHDVFRSGRLMRLAGAMAVCLMAGSANAVTIETTTSGNWTNTATWVGGVQPGISDRAEVYHDVTITNDVGTINILDGNASGSVTMNGGTLNVTAGDWNGIDTFSLSNGSTLDFNRFTRAVGTWTVDNSSLLFGTVPQSWTQIQIRNNFDCTVRNGSTFWTDSLNCSGNGNQQTITAEGAGNTLHVGYLRNGDGNGDTNFKFVMDGTDTALSTWTFDDLDLDFETRSWNLIVDATAYNGVNASFTLFSGVDNSSTLSGSFDSFNISGTNGYVTYEYSDASSTATIILNIGEPDVPTVTVEVPDAAAAEEGSNPGTIRITRDDTSGDLDVYYTIGGSADSSDYTESYTSPATITDGNSFVDLNFTPVDDLDLEGNQTIELAIALNAAYVAGSPSSGSITISDNEEGTITSVADGNWTNAATWSSVVPEADRTVDVRHDVTVDSVVDDINVLTGNTSGRLLMDGGTLDVLNGGWNGLTTHSMSNGSTLAFNDYTRFKGSVMVDDSTLTFGSSVAFRGADVDMTIANGATFTTPKIVFWDVRNHAITIDGSGNSVTNGFHDTDGDAGTMTYTFVMDDTDAALSTFNYTTLDLDCENYAWNLVVDATEWNGVTTTFTLFDATTLTGTFDSTNIIGASGAVSYDAVNHDVTLTLVKTSTDYYWDNNGDTAGFGTAAGTWAVPTTGDATQGWSTDSTGQTQPGNVTTTDDVLYFGTAAAGLGAGAVTVSGTVEANRLNFGSASGDITLSGGAIVLGGDFPRIEVDNTSNTVSSAISNTVGLLKKGSGALTLSGINTYIGDTTIDAGKLQIGGAGQLDEGDYAGVVSIGSASTFDYNSSADQTLSGNITGDGTLVKGSSGALTLSGANTYAGDTTISAGSLKLSGGSAIPDGAGKGDVTVNGTLDLNGASETINGLSGLGTVDNTAAGAATLTVGGDDDTSSFGGTVTGSVGDLTLNKLGSGTLTLTGAGNSLADVSAAGGSLVLSGNSTTTLSGTMLVANSGVSGGDNGTLTITNNALLTVAGGFYMGNRQNKIGTANQGGGTVTLNTTDGNGTRFGHWAGTQGNYTLSGGTLNVLNAEVNLGWSGTGNLAINGGTANLKGVDFADSGDGNNSVTLGGGTLNVGVSGIRGGGVAYAINLNSGTLGALAGWSSALNMTLGGSVDIDTTSGNIGLSGDLTGAGGFTKVGTGTLTLSSSSGATGGTTVSGGTLKVDDDRAVNSGTLTVNGGTLDVNDEISMGATGISLVSGSIIGASNLTANASGVFDMQAGTVDAVLAGAGALTKTTAGTVVLNGANLYSGATVVSNGVLLVNGSLSADSSVTVDSGGTLGGTGMVHGALSVLSGGSVAPGESTGILQASNVTFQSGSSLAIEIDDAATPVCDTLAVSGALNISGATLNVSASGLPASTYVIATYPSGQLTGTFAGTSGLPGGYSVIYDYSGGTAIALVSLGATLGVWDGDSDGNWTDATNWAGDVAPESGASLVFDDGSNRTTTNDFAAGTAFSLQLDATGFELTGAAIDLTDNGSGEITTSGSGANTITLDMELTSDSDISVGGGVLAADGEISGAFALTKDGGGTLTLGGTNTYSGDTTIDASAGTLQIDGAGQLGSGSYAGAIAIGSGATFDYSSSADQTLSGDVTGDGLLTKGSSGTLTLSGANSYVGNTTVNAGSLKLSGGSAIPDGAGKGDVTVDGTLDLNGSSETINGLSGSGSVDNSSATAATLAVGADNDTTSFSGTIAGSVGDLTFNKLGTGTLTLTGAGNSLADVSAAGGNLLLAGSSTLTVADVMMVANSGITGGDNGTLTITNSASLTVGGNFLAGNKHNKVGTMNQSGGTVTLNGTTIRFGVWNGAHGNYTLSGGTLNALNAYTMLGYDGYGTLSVNGGIANLKGVLVDGRGSAASEIDTLNLGGGILNVGSAGIDKGGASGANAYYAVNLNSGTLGALAAWSSDADMTLGGAVDIDTTGGAIALSAILSGAGGFTKVGTGTLTLSGANDYTGETAVSGGVLALAAGASLNTATIVRINGSGTLDLDGSIDQTVEELWIDGVQMYRSTWGSTSSGAILKNDTYFAGAGIITVTSGPAPPTLFKFR